MDLESLCAAVVQQTTAIVHSGLHLGWHPQCSVFDQTYYAHKLF